MNRVRFSAVALLVLVLASVLASVGAQDAPAVNILPVNHANFLPGAMFDMRVEVAADALPEDFAVTINGTAAVGFFGAEFAEESWTVGDEATPVVSIVARNLMFAESGEYVVEVVAGGVTTSTTYTVREVGNAGAKNVILFIADGASVPFFTATRLVSRGQENGYYNDHLSFETFEEFGLLSTSGTDSIITDSANSASAYNNGHKTAVNANGVYADSSADAYDDPRVETFAELVTRTRGMSVGIVTNANWQDATPAAVFAHSRERNDRSSCDFARSIVGAEGTLSTNFVNVMPAIVLGGGGRFALAPSVDGSRCKAENYDGVDFDGYAAYEAAGYSLVETNDQLQAAVEAGDERIMGIFAGGNMDTWLDRNVFGDNAADQPGLVDMTLAALQVVSKNENGFYLEVEAAHVDKQLHPMDFDRALAEGIEFDRTIAATVEYLEANGMMENTLIIVTADHGHSFDVYGTVDVEAFNAAEDEAGKRAAIGIYQNAGSPTYVDEDGDMYPDNWAPSVTLAMGKVDHPAFTEDFQVSETPREPSINDENGVTLDNPEDDPNGLVMSSNLPDGSTSSVHTLQDVPVYAQGPGSEALRGVNENIEVFFAMANAIGLDPRQ